jgi:hypothetical protein
MADEQQGNGTVRTGMILLSTGFKSVEYAEVDGMAVFEGDIVLGTVEELEGRNAAMEADSVFAEGVAITGDQFRWPNCTIPFTIDPRLASPDRVRQAIAHWEQRTNYRFIPRTNEPDFVTFRPGTGCSSAVGRRGFQQFVDLAPECGIGNTIHEIGHTIGLWHEQSRADRDQFVRINFRSVRPASAHNFNQHITDGDDIGPYDYGSIMHYPRNAFSSDGNDTVIPVDPNAQIGQRRELSAGDIAAANGLCRRIDQVEQPQPPVTGGGKRRSVRS